MKAALYTRVSTQEQVAEGYSLGAQAEKLRNYAKAMEYTVVDLYSDEGYSGGNTNRPALQRLIKDINNNNINIVLIYKLDRLSRNVKDVLELVELFGKKNVTLFSMTENIDLSSPFGRAALKMSATFSELERDTITERMQLGKLARAKSGKYIAPGKAPFGYRYNYATKKLDLIPEEAEIVKRVFKLYTDGMSIRDIFSLCSKDYPDVHFFQTRNYMGVKAMIMRPIYAGYYIYRGVMYKANNIDSVISYDTWLKANKTRESKGAIRRQSSPYLLTGLIVCSQCGQKFTVKTSDHLANGKKYRYYSYGCAARLKYTSREFEHKCHNQIYNMEELDKYVSDKIKNLDFASADISALQSEASKIAEENAALFKQKEKLLDIYMDGFIDKDTFTLRNKALEDKITRNNTLIELEAQKPTIDNNVTLNFLKKQVAKWDTLDIIAKRQLLHLLLKYISIDGEKINFVWRIFK